MVEVEVNLGYTLEVSWDVEQAFALVADVPFSAGHFPGLERLDDLGDGVYRWNMRAFEVGKVRHQVCYAARYVSDPGPYTVTWHTVGTDSNTRADGSWHVTPHGDGAQLRFENRLTVRLAIPRLVARPAKKVVLAIMEKQTQRYLERIAGRMDGRLLG